VTAERVYRVGELTREVKLALEGGFGRLWVEGEITGFRRQASGHCYFALKDETAQLSAVLFAGTPRSPEVPLADGAMVRVWGDLTVYEPRGQYQIVVRRVLAAGAGALMQRFEALKRRLAAEGLFEAARKRPMPLLPRRVGIVTSPTGAAIRDILAVVRRRFPNLHVIVAPVRVQGAGAAEEIAAAIDLLNRVGGPDAEPDGARVCPPLDVLIVTRGGGSLEDLWPFNEEIVARAVARSALPVVSAVGHEVDFTICDFAADLRAPTPSAAAEMLVGRKQDFEATLRGHAKALAQELRQRLLEARGRLEAARVSHVFRAPRHAVERSLQRLDAIEAALRAAAAARLASWRARCAESAGRLGVLRAGRAPALRGHLRELAGRLAHTALRAAVPGRGRLEGAAAALRALNPLAVLDRGYSLTRTAAGELVRSVRQARPGVRLRTRVADGEFESIV
jgi:exodeoxyribonuclease VII large subunit